MPSTLPSNSENTDIVRRAHGFIYTKDLHPKHFINPANEQAVRDLHRASWDPTFAGLEYRVKKKSPPPTKGHIQISATIVISHTCQECYVD